MLWLVPASRWRISSKADVAMLVLSLLVTVAIVPPDTFFAPLK
jgi:hypothetical protein